MSFLSKLNPFKSGSRNPLDPTQAIRSIEHAADQAISNAVKKVEKTVEDKLQDVAKEVGHQIKDELGKLEGDLEDLIVQGLLALANETMKPGLALGAKIARKTDQLMKPIFDSESEADKAALGKVPFVLPITAGVVSIGFYWYDVFNGKRLHAIADDLDRYSHTGIKASRNQIIQAVKDFGPDHVDIGVGVKFSLGVQFGVTPSVWSIPTKYFLRLADELMKEAGVPA